jgi:hypothetical protein
MWSIELFLGDISPRTACRAVLMTLHIGVAPGVYHPPPCARSFPIPSIRPLALCMIINRPTYLHGILQVLQYGLYKYPADSDLKTKNVLSALIGENYVVAFGGRVTIHVYQGSYFQAVARVHMYLESTSRRRARSEIKKIRSGVTEILFQTQLSKWYIPIW